MIELLGVPETPPQRMLYTLKVHTVAFVDNCGLMQFTEDDFEVLGHVPQLL